MATNYSNCLCIIVLHWGDSNMAASDLIKDLGETSKGLQTISNRDLVNRFYLARYESCVEALTTVFDSSRLFQTRVRQLYYSFVIPRKHLVSELGYQEFDFKSKEECEVLLERIGRKMYELGINKTEQVPTDPNHGFVEEEEVLE